jgi:hypothetical protein
MARGACTEGKPLTCLEASCDKNGLNTSFPGEAKIQILPISFQVAF